MSQCTVADPTSAWLEKAPGTWSLTSAGSGWLTDTVVISGTASEGATITISSSGEFTAGNTTFTFVGVDSTGVFAIYAVSEIKYIALGFNNDYDILYVSTVYTSSDITVTATTGNIFLTK